MKKPFSDGAKQLPHYEEAGEVQRAGGLGEFYVKGEIRRNPRRIFVHPGREQRVEPEHGLDTIDVNDLPSVHSASSEPLLYDTIFMEDLLSLLVSHHFFPAIHCALVNEFYDGIS